MTADDFNAWLDHMGWSMRKASIELGVSKNTIPRYREDGAPLHIALACAALTHGLPPWKVAEWK